jgi:hypothetical protein
MPENGADVNPENAPSVNDVERAMIAIAKRWAERDGLDPAALDCEPRRSVTIASMRKDEVDLDIKAGLSALSVRTFPKGRRPTRCPGTCSCDAVCGQAIIDGQALNA